MSFLAYALTELTVAAMKDRKYNKKYTPPQKQYDPKEHFVFTNKMPNTLLHLTIAVGIELLGCVIYYFSYGDDDNRFGYCLLGFVVFLIGVIVAALIGHGYTTHMPVLKYTEVREPAIRDYYHEIDYRRIYLVIPGFILAFAPSIIGVISCGRCPFHSLLLIWEFIIFVIVAAFSIPSFIDSFETISYGERVAILEKRAKEKEELHTIIESIEENKLQENHKS